MDSSINLTRRGVSAAAVGLMERLDTHACDAGGDHLKAARRFQGNVEDAIPFEWTPVVNADDD